MEIILKTQRLALSPVSLADLGKIHELHMFPETDRFNTLGIPESIGQTEKIIKGWIEKNTSGKNNCFNLKIELDKSREFVGLIALNLGAPKFRIAEVWYKLHPDFWKKGYATEALDRILDFGFNQLELHRIEAGCAVENFGSIRVLEKVGMTREGRKRQVLPLKDGWSDNFHYAILASDFKQASN